MNRKIEAIVGAIAGSQKPALEKIRDLTSLYFNESRNVGVRDLGMIVLSIETIATKELIMANGISDDSQTGQR